MIKPTDKDIGRRVIYTPSHGGERRGIIKSFTDKWVFVRCHEGDTAAATKRKDLKWAEPMKDITAEEAVKRARKIIGDAYLISASTKFEEGDASSCCEIILSTVNEELEDKEFTADSFRDCLKKLEAKR